MDIHKKYSLVKDHEKHFEIHDSTDGQRFNVAKKDIHPATQIKLMKMQKFAEGGDVPEDAPPSLDLSVPTEVTPSGGGLQFQPPPGQMAEAFPGEAAQSIQTAKDAPVWDPSRGLKKDAFSGYQDPSQKAPDSAPMPQSVDPSQLATQQAPQAQPVPGQDLMGSFNKAFGLEQQAAQEQFKGQAAAAQAQDKLYGDQATAFQGLKDSHDQEMSKLNQKSQDMFDNLQNGKLDPDNYWKGHSKIAAGLGMLLSGIGSGLSGQRNMALDVINKGIDNDIDIQKTNINQKNNLFHMNMQLSHSKDEAYARTKNDMLTIAAAKANQIAAQLGTPQAMANRDNLLAQIGIQKATLQKQIATQGISNAAYTDGVPPQAVPYLHPDQQKRMVRLSNGNMADAGSEANAKEYNEQTAAYTPLMSDLSELKSLNTLGNRMDPAQRARAHELIGHTVVSLNDLAKSHRISESDIGFQAGQLSDPTAMSTLLSGNAATEQLMKSLTRKMDAVGQTYVPAIGNLKAKQSKVLSGFKASK